MEGGGGGSGSSMTNSSVAMTVGGGGGGRSGVALRGAMILGGEHGGSGAGGLRLVAATGTDTDDRKFNCSCDVVNDSGLTAPGWLGWLLRCGFFGGRSGGIGPDLCCPFQLDDGDSD